MCKGNTCDECICTCGWELMYPKRGPWVRIHKEACEMHGTEGEGHV